MSIHCSFRGVVAILVASWTIAGLVHSTALAQPSAPQPAATVSAVMLSDLHLDPFHDPAKAPQLVKAPVEEWQAILSSPDSPSQEADFAAVQSACKGKQSFDSPYALLASGLKAAKAQAVNAQFVVVSGDLLVHNLDCRYRASMKLPKAAGDDQSVSAAFAEKTTVFVMKQVEQVFAGIPVYLALGNNDSRCNHNRLDVHDAYLQATGQAVVDGLVGVSEPERKLALTTYGSAGYYGVAMAAPMQNTRLLVLDDIYMMSKFANCEADETDQNGAQEQMAWLTKELDDARKRGQRVWVLGHVPPAVNPKGSLMNPTLCTKGDADAYLSSDALSNALSVHADVVRLAIFGHTHMDELHLVGTKGAEVPMKIIPSVSPVEGNTPSVTVAKVDPASATLLDYTAYIASNTTGVNTTWTREYSFDETYGETSFTAKALDDLIGRFRADTTGTSAESLAYQTHFYKGHTPIPLGPFWEGYVCSLDHAIADGFKNCVCGGK